MLAMRPNCECCDRDLPADAADALICSFECTFCAACGRDRLNGRCPNCAGALTSRPPRAQALWSTFPPSTKRIARAAPCPAAP
jgi:hypothetical protein